MKSETPHYVLQSRTAKPGLFWSSELSSWVERERATVYREDERERSLLSGHWVRVSPPETSERVTERLPSVMQVVMGEVSGYDIRHITPTLPEKNPHHYGVRTKVTPGPQTEATPLLNCSTARPWRVADDGRLGSILGPDGDTIAQTQQLINDNLLHEKRKANAELVVRAVNGYDSAAAQIATLTARVKELETRDRLWNSVFGTSQLTHAKARLESAESKVATLKAENEWLRKQAENLQESVREASGATIEANNKVTALEKALREALREIPQSRDTQATRMRLRKLLPKEDGE